MAIFRIKAKLGSLVVPPLYRALTHHFLEGAGECREGCEANLRGDLLDGHIAVVEQDVAGLADAHLGHPGIECHVAHLVQVAR